MRVPLSTVLREWGRLGLIGFGGPPAHVALLRELCVERRGWLQAREFEDANAACQLLPGPASTQLAIYCAWRVGGAAGAVLGGVAFIVPGLLMILVIAAAALSSSPPAWLRGVGAGAGAAVVAVVVAAG
ncbi:MAG TPA: chromate transporter, partial [Solirubrobacteraceae bacterium]|nr:chromate transporter [Solirubrobacteraceae bacterium]